MDIKYSCLEIANLLEPYYKELISGYSKSYISGSDWYVGESLTDWWKKESLNLLNLKSSRKQLIHILQIVLLHKKKINTYYEVEDPFETFVKQYSS